MRILFFADGGSVHSHRWIGWFVRAGHEVHVASWVEWEGEAPVAEHRVEFMGPRRGAGVPKVRAVSRGRHLGEQAQAVADDVRPDLVHGHYLDGYGHLAYLSRVRPSVLTVWGSDVYGERPTMQARLNRKALAAADAVTVDSTDLASRVIELGAHAEKVHEVHFGVDTSVFRPTEDADRAAMRARLGIASDARVIFSPRALRPLYDIASVVRAFADLLDPDTWLVAMAFGEEQAYGHEVRDLVEELGVGERVALVPRASHAEMARLYGAADVVVSMALSDSSPVSLLEAMACGVPVVARDVPGLSDWIHDGENGLLVEGPGLTGALTQALSLDEATRSRWSDANRAEVEARASQDLNMRAVEALYVHLVESRR